MPSACTSVPSACTSMGLVVMEASIWLLQKGILLYDNKLQVTLSDKTY